MGFWQVMTIIFAFVAVTGWATAIHQAKRADHWMNKYKKLKKDKMGDAIITGASAAVADRALSVIGFPGGGESIDVGGDEDGE